MNTNSYLILIAIVIGMFMLWVCHSIWHLLKSHVIPLYPHNMDRQKAESTIASESPILKESVKRKPKHFTDEQLWEREHAKRNPN